MYVFGASGHAKVIIESLLSRDIDVEGIFDDDLSIKSILGFKVLGRFDRELVLRSQMIIGIGNNSIREKIAELYRAEFGNAIHFSSVVSPSAILGNGVAIMARAVINADSKIGDHVIINTSASVDHDCTIGDFSHVAPNSTICGGIKIGRRTLVGAGAVIGPNLTIGNDVVIGAGAVVTQNVGNNMVVVGHNKIIKQ